MNGPPLRIAEVVTVGDELLLGETADTNFPFLASRLALHGIRIERHVTVGDETEAIRDAIQDAAEMADLVIVTGGLGVTPDDRTRQALAEVAGVRLIPDRATLDEIEVFYRDRKIRMPSINVAQASIPEGAEKIANRVGLAPGLHVRIRRCEVFAFPGVPGEMRQMTEGGLMPWIRERCGEAAIDQRILRTWGIGENALAERLGDYLAVSRPVEIAFLPERRGVTLRFRLRKGDYENATHVLDDHVEEAASILGNLVYSTREEELEEVVGYLLLLHRKTIAVAESCTGGRVSDLLTSVPGSSAYFREGFVPYDAARKIETLGIPEDLIHEKGTVSLEVAGELARQARTIADTDIGLGVTGVAGPDTMEGKPVGRVFLALATRIETTFHQLDVPGSREKVKERAARSAVNQIRLHLIGGKEGLP